MIASGTPLDAAKTNVRSRLNLDEATDLTQDFVAKKDTALMETAQMLTIAIGEVKAEAKTGETTDRQAFFVALEYLQEKVAALQAAFTDAKKDGANANAKPVDLVKEAFKVEDAKPVVADFVARAKRITESAPASASAVVALIEQGSYTANHALEACSFLGADEPGYCRPNYWKVLGSAGKITQDWDYRLENGAWVKDASSGDNNFTLTSAGWKNENDCAAGQSVTYAVGSDGVTTVTFCDGTSERITARTVEASGKTLSALNLNPPEKFAETTMPAGSQMSWLTFANTEDQYDLYTGYEVGKWVYENNTSGKVPYTALNAFIQDYTQPNADTPNSSYTYQWSNLVFSFAADGALNLYKWTPVIVNGVNSYKLDKNGTSTYTLAKKHGVEVLIINAQAPENDPGERIIFAVKEGKVYGGTFRPKTAKNDTEAVFNKTMINAILNAGSKPAVLD